MTEPTYAPIERMCHCSVRKQASIVSVVSRRGQRTVPQGAAASLLGLAKIDWRIVAQLLRHRAVQVHA